MKNCQWCNLGKNHFDSVCFMDRMVTRVRQTWGIHEEDDRNDTEKIQNLLEMEYTYTYTTYTVQENNGYSILGQEEMVLFERIIICRWYNASTCSSYGGNVVSYTLGI